MQSGGGAGGGPGRNPAGRAASTSSAAASPSSSSSAASHLESLQQQQQQQQQIGSRQAFLEIETDGIVESGNDWVQICAADAVNSNLASFSSHDSMHSSVDF